MGGQAKPYQARQVLRGYIADIPDLEVCSAFGPTPQQALAEVLRATEAWLQSTRARGEPVAEPRYRLPLNA